MTISRGNDVGPATEACQAAVVGGATGICIGHAFPPHAPCTCCIAGIALALLKSSAEECYERLQNPIIPQKMV